MRPGLNIVGLTGNFNKGFEIWASAELALTIGGSARWFKFF